MVFADRPTVPLTLPSTGLSTRPRTADDDVIPPGRRGRGTSPLPERSALVLPNVSIASDRLLLTRDLLFLE